MDSQKEPKMFRKVLYCAIISPPAERAQSAESVLPG